MNPARSALLALSLIGCGGSGSRAETPSPTERVLLRIETPVGTRYPVLSEAQIDLAELGQMRARTHGEVVADARDEDLDTTTFTYHVGAVTMLDPDGEPVRAPMAMPAMVITTTLAADGSVRTEAADEASPAAAMQRQFGQLSMVTYAPTPVAVGDHWTSTAHRNAMFTPLECTADHQLVGLRDGSDGRVAQIEWEEHCVGEPIPRTEDGRTALVAATLHTTGSGEVLVSDALHGHLISRSEIVVTITEEGQAPREANRTVNLVEIAIGLPI